MQKAKCISALAPPPMGTTPTPPLGRSQWSSSAGGQSGSILSQFPSIRFFIGVNRCASVVKNVFLQNEPNFSQYLPHFLKKLKAN
jgi:hypothetical protein